MAAPPILDPVAMKKAVVSWISTDELDDTVRPFQNENTGFQSFLF
jgi:hypothetical protein